MNNCNNLHIIIYSSFPAHSGGRENWLFNLLPYLSKNYNKIIIYSLSSKKHFYNIDNLDNVEVIGVYTLSKLGIVYKMINLIFYNLLIYFDMFFIFGNIVKWHLKRNLEHADVILAMNSVIEVTPAKKINKRKLNYRLICSVRGLVPEELDELFPFSKTHFKIKEKENLRCCDKVLANGYDTKQYLLKMGIISTVVPNGVDIELFSKKRKKNDLQNLFPFDNTKNKVIMMVASLRRIKGTADIIRTGKFLLEGGIINFKIVLIGKGNQEKYKNIAWNLGIREHIVFLGERKNISEFLSMADVVVCLSGGGGMSLSLLEAMATGKPIVAWDTPVYRQLINNSIDGFLVQFKNYEMLAEKIIELLSNEETAKYFSENVRKKIEFYDWKNIANKLLKEIK